MPTIRLVEVTDPSTGISRWIVIACSPCTSMAKLNSPMAATTFEPPWEITTPWVGSSRCGRSMLFSVVKASSSRPAPTPRA